MAAVDSVRHLRTELLPRALGRVPGVEYAVSGEIARGLDYSAYQGERIPWGIGFVCLATLLVTVAVFGSVVLAALGVVINLAAVVVAGACWRRCSSTTGPRDCSASPRPGSSGRGCR
ncbi:hypothetical protein [Pseudonocardia lacus]|uniref:hypothetical protein n=1 Tax=Pseudonocardia lacus TaxID=2835865 RepID=UPI001BDBBBAD|nr:hypothetical protein [Pseudonocardia lacus]